MSNNNNTTYTPQAGDIVAWERTTSITKYDYSTRRYVEIDKYTATSVAVMTSQDDFSVCLNFRGLKEEQDRLWQFDSTPSDCTIRRATTAEALSLILALGKQGFQFSIDRLTVRTRMAGDTTNAPGIDASAAVPVPGTADAQPCCDDAPPATAPAVPKPETSLDMPDLSVARSLMRNELSLPDKDLRKVSPERKFRRYIAELTALYKANHKLKGMSRISSALHISAITKDDFHNSRLDELCDIEWLFTQEGTIFCAMLYNRACTHGNDRSAVPVVPPSARMHS